MIKYDENYFYNLLKIHTATAPDIVARRYKFINDNLFPPKPQAPIDPNQTAFVAPPPITLLDYGCGVGFMKALAPYNYCVDTFDIMPTPTTGITREEYDIITMYDVLEHIPDFQDVAYILRTAKYAVISVPVKPADVPWKGYKHFKPGEHLHYFTDDLIKHLFDYMGFDFICQGNPECPPRQYITSYIFKNRNL